VPRHDLDALSLMTGVGFCGIALVGLLSQVTAVAARWTCPLLLILVGVVGLVASRRGAKP
jgi:multidrug transporter EmrE-like cation transporter